MLRNPVEIERRLARLGHLEVNKVINIVPTLSGHKGAYVIIPKTNTYLSVPECIVHPTLANFCLKQASWVNCMSPQSSEMCVIIDQFYKHRNQST